VAAESPLDATAQRAPRSLSRFRQITTSLGRLLAFIRLLLDLPARVVLSLEATPRLSNEGG